MNLSSVEDAVELGAMSLTSLFRKATNLLGFGGDSNRPRPPPLDGEIIYCKNNVCVHPPANLKTGSGDHFPGYLNIRSQDDDVLGSTLILTWIPNSTLKKNPRSIENSPAQTRVTPRRSPRQEYARIDYPTSSTQSPTNSAGDVDSTASSSLGGCHGDLCMLGPATVGDEADETLAVENDSTSKNNMQSSSTPGHNCMARVGIDVNPLHEKCSNLLVQNTVEQTVASDSGSGSQHSIAIGAARQLAMLRSRSDSSSKSVASVEMEGENLVIVTEEIINDDAFVDASETTGSSAVESETVLSEQYKQTMDKLTTAASKSVSAVNPDSVQKLRQSLDLQLNLVQNNDFVEKVSDFDFELASTSMHVEEARKSSSSSSSSTSGPDSVPPSPSEIADIPQSLQANSDVTADEQLDTDFVKHCMSFPENSVDYSADQSPSDMNATFRTAAEQVCSVFSVDLGQMRSLRIFYSDEACTNGQLVIASRESQYKILHFHHGGLDRLAETFADWKFLAQPKHKGGDADTHSRQFSVIRPYLTNAQCHPEDGALEMVSEETWRQHMNEHGQIEDDFHLRKAIFFAGLESSLRHEVWPFLLHYFPYSSTFEERDQIRNDRYIEYHNIRKTRERMPKDEKEAFWKAVQCTVEKDVVRTDRSHPYFSGDGNPNIDILKSILLNYAVAHPIYGYTQGMSDLLAPVLAEIQNEVDAYWCFVGLMQKTSFFSSPTDADMDCQLMYLRELLRVLLPHFHRHLEKVQDGLELLFCHRWLLLCFKREFVESDALRLWEACWARHQTDYFHLFVCAAVIAVYGEDVVQQDLPADEMLLHFSSLSMHMSGEVVLRKARGLLHQFRTLRRIPCTLEGLCTKCGPGMWDSGHVPAIECSRNHPDGVCPSVLNANTSL